MSTAKPNAMLTAIILAICRNTDNPKVSYYDEDRIVVIHGIHPADEGRIIGRKGAVFRALMVLHYYACRYLGMEQYTIEPLETSTHPDTGKSPTFLPRMDWDKARITAMIEAVLSYCFPSAAWVLERDGEDVTARVRISKDLKPDPLDPSFESALDTIIHTAGKSCGVNLHTEVIWA